MTVYRLIVLRHAKSDWGLPALNDHSRPLSARGVTDAPKVGAALLARGWAPQVVVASDARRTRDTWEFMSAAFTSPIGAYFEAALYLGGGRRLVRAAKGIPDDVVCAMLLGHNPDCEEAVSYLCGAVEHLGTTNAVLLETDAKSWDDAVGRPGGWELVDILRPKSLGGAPAGGYPRGHGR